VPFIHFSFFNCRLCNKHAFNALVTAQASVGEAIVICVYFFLISLQIPKIVSNTRVQHAVGQWFPTFSDRVPFVGPVLSPRTTLFQENSISPIWFDQKCGKSELAQMRH